VKAFLDTSVLVATFFGDHEHHAASLDVFTRFGLAETCCAAHSLAEFYATATAMPGRWRVSGDAAVLFVREVCEQVTVISLDPGDYSRALDDAARAGLSGGALYDALLGWCALKANAETIYTWNVKDFLRLPAGVAGRVRRPDQ
jgi:predicted nucleic acid-binding protein